MDRQHYTVGPGWWLLLDQELPQLYEIDPDLSGLEIKEKYGYCSIHLIPSAQGRKRVDLLGDVVSSIESQSVTICENCGRHRSTPSKWYPWCDQCKAASPVERSQIREETKRGYLNR